jgi:hypothetical protein
MMPRSFPAMWFVGSFIFSGVLSYPTFIRAAQPATQPAREATPPPAANAAFEAGRALAKKDRGANIVGEKLPVPETFLMMWMMPDSSDANLLEYYQAIVADRFGVKSEEVMFHAGLTDPIDWAHGYNAEMQPDVEKRAGAHGMNKAWKEACATSKAKRAKYLEQRQTKGNPATQPASTQRADEKQELNK